MFLFCPWTLISYMNITKRVKMPPRNDLLSTYVKFLLYFDVQSQCYKPIQHKNNKKKTPRKLCQQSQLSPTRSKYSRFTAHIKPFILLHWKGYFQRSTHLFFLTFKYLNPLDHASHCSSHPGHETVKLQVTDFYLRKSSSLLNKTNSFPHIKLEDCPSLPKSQPLD